MRLDTLTLAHELLALEWREKNRDSLRTGRSICIDEQTKWWEKNHNTWWVIRDNNDRPVGYCGMEDVHHTYAEISFLLDPPSIDYWPEAFHAFITEVFKRRTLRTVTSEIFCDSPTGAQWIRAGRRYGAHQMILHDRKQILPLDLITIDNPAYVDSWFLEFRRDAVCESSS